MNDKKRRETNVGESSLHDRPIRSGENLSVGERLGTLTLHRRSGVQVLSGPPSIKC